MWEVRLQGKDCSQQSFCISTIPGGQMQKLEQRRERLPRIAPGDRQGCRKVEQRRSSCRNSDRVESW